MNSDFKPFASKQDSLFVNAYKQKDIKAYNNLLQEFFTKYNDLTEAEKKQYANFYINATVVHYEYYPSRCLLKDAGNRCSPHKYFSSGTPWLAHLPIDR